MSVIGFILGLLGIIALAFFAYVAGVASGMLATYEKIRGCKGEPAAKEFIQFLKTQF